jgi:hypothetical protein
MPAAMTKPFTYWNISFIKWWITANRKVKKVYIHIFIEEPTNASD